MGKPSERDIARLQKDLDSQLAQVEKRKPETRDDLARMLVAVFAALLLVIVIGGPIYNAAFSQLKNFDQIKVDVGEMLQAISTVMGPVIGFVIGYYFKSRSE